MKVNLISNFKPRTGLMQDVHIIRGIWTSVHEETQFFRVHHMLPECPDADVNIFMEVISPSLFPYAGRNIWIPNPEWTYKTWIHTFPKLMKYGQRHRNVTIYLRSIHLMSN